MRIALDTASKIQHRIRSLTANRLTAAFYLLVIVLGVFLISVPFSSAAQQEIMMKFHLKTPSFARFAIMQLVPSMYNFDNEAAVSAHVIAGDAFSSGRPLRFQTNHYPLRVVSFGLKNRPEFLKGNAPKYVYLRTRFNTQELNSLYIIEQHANTLNVKLER